MPEIAKAIRVSGLVQGVGFRWMTKRVADQLKIRGLVKNQADGSVYIEACGDENAMQQFTAAIKASPSPSGRVTAYQEQILSKEFPINDFVVTY